ncbi:MAG TPA: lytic transglycosylase F [Burkholderiales bacterium]|nr:lytic transglycosylase F [Burkholderiales bacterium]
MTLADGSLLRFRSTVDRRLDRLPLREIDTLRVLVNYTRTNFFVSKHEPRGFEYEYLREFERFLNERVRRQKHPIRLEFVVTDLDRALPDLLEGRGDIAAASLTITPARQQKVDFSLPYLVDVDEIVVTNRKVSAPASLAALGGKRIVVVRGSSYAEHLQALARAQRAAGKAPVEVVEASSGIESEDILELVNAGVVDYTVVDSHRAKLWAQVLPMIAVHEKLAVNVGGNIAWAVRPESRELREALDAFIDQDGARSTLNRMIFDRYFRDTRWIENPEARPLLRRQAAVVEAIKKYSAAAGLDWRLVLAQALAASNLESGRRGADGAIGIMQVTPEMAAKVGVTDIDRPERNIEAGVRYLASLRDEYARGDRGDAGSMDLAVAAYRMGPRQVQTLQRYARDLGLDPARWERNVELVADLTLGDQRTHEVNEVYLYFEAFRLDEAAGSPPARR